MGLLIGALVSVLFSVLPLVSVRFVPPLSVLRSGTESPSIVFKTKIGAIVLIALFPFAFAAIQTKNIMTGAFFFLGLAAALGCLTLVAIGLLFLVRKFFPANAGFILTAFAFKPVPAQ